MVRRRDAPLLLQSPRRERAADDLIPVARRALGDGNEITLHLRKVYARILYEDPAATLDDLCEAVTTIAEAARTARRVLGGAHPSTENFERSLKITQTYYRRKMQIN